MKVWECISHNPTKWGLGDYDKESGGLRDIIATVTRRNDGNWNWSILLPHFNPQGIEPSRLIAIKAVGEIIEIYTQATKEHRRCFL